MPHLPVRVYALEVPPGDIPVPADFEELPASLRITMAAIDPSAPAQLDSAPSGQTTARATLKIIKVTSDEVDSEDDSEEDEDYDSDDIAAIESRLRGAIGGSEDDSEDDESDDSEEGNGGPSDPTKTKKARKEAAVKALLESLKEDADMEDVEELSNGLKNSKGKERASDDDEEDDSEIESEDDSEVEEFVICTLDPTQHYQQPIDITIGENEQVFFKVIGTHSVYLTGNYIADVKEDSEDDEDYDEDYYGDGLEADSDDYDEDSDDLDDLDDPRITEIDSEEEEAPQLVKAAKKGKNKRPADESEEDTSTLDALISKSTKSADAAAASSEKLSKKQAKKLKNNQGQAVASAELNGTNGTTSAIKKDANGANGTPNSAKSDKKVQFAKNLEQGPTGSPLPKADNKAAAKDEKKDDGKPKASLGVKVVQGVKIDDKKLGKGPAAKKGDRVGMRYIGKLESNGQVFDSNKKGAPFSFKLGKGEVIQGWDIGVAGMSVGGERRLTIPAKLAYKNQKVPGIPPNSTLVFDVKLVEIK